MDTVVDFFIQGVDAFITALIVSFLVIMLSYQNQMAVVVSENHAMQLTMQEYREYNAYDHRHVYAADVISLLLKKKGYPEIEVVTPGGTYRFNLNSTPIEYDVDKLYDAISPEYLYDADITKYTDPTYSTGVETLRFRYCNDPNCQYK